MKVVALFLAMVTAVAAFTHSPSLSSRRATTARRRFGATTDASTTPTMANLPPGSTCLVLGSGWIQLLTAKTAARAGYKTYVFTSQDPEPAKKLIYSKACPRDSIPLEFLEISDKAACEEVLANLDAVLIASDSDTPVKPGVLNTVLPEDAEAAGYKCKVKKIVFMSRNGCSGREGSGAGLGFIIAGAKDFSNPDIWAGGEYIAAFTALEGKVMEKAKAIGADYTIVRAGTLKGGGPGLKRDQDGRNFPRAQDSLAESIYKTGAAGRNWRAVFDTGTVGAAIVPGDSVAIPAAGWFSIKASISFDVEPGDTGRLACALAMVESLNQEKAANTDFAVKTASAREPPTKDEWNELFKVL